MCNTIISENSVLWDTKLLAWEGRMSFSFIEEENFKGILNDFLNDFKFASDRIDLNVQQTNF